MVQLWVNLPAKDKMSKPKYQAITNSQINKFKLTDNGGEIEVIAGDYKNIKGAAFTFTPVHLLNAKLNKGAKADFTFPSTYNTALLVIEGSIQVNESTPVPTDHFVLFENDGESFTIAATENAIILILSGEPINEPIAAQGPFVMNSKEEIYQAIQDFRNGRLN